MTNVDEQADADVDPDAPAAMSTRERIGWALLFGLPVGAGIGLATSRMAGTGLADPLVVGTAVAFAALVAGLLLLVTGVNQDEDATTGTE